MTPYINVKWPGLLVKGDPVTRDQAAEILVRTYPWPCSSNSHAADRAFNEMAGLPRRPDYDEVSTNPELSFQYWKDLDSRLRTLGVLGLEFLRNEMLTSSWVGGPFGWCSWDGKIYACNHNVGKWPTIGEVTEEWEKIAFAFPFLRLRAQMLGGEIMEDTEESWTPTAEWQIADGKVEVRWPTELLIPRFAVGVGHTVYDYFNTKVADYEDVRRGISLALANQKTAKEEK